MTTIHTKSPVDNSIYVERELSTHDEISTVIDNARHAQKNWQLTSLSHRMDIMKKFSKLLEQNKSRLAEEITWQMGRPIAQSPGEIDGACNRLNYMTSIAEQSLSDIVIPNSDQSKHLNSKLKRKIKHTPVGLVFIIAPWNYPYLTAINTLGPALLAGNSVILKHSAQTPLCSENIVKLLLEAGLPEYVCQYLHISHEDTNQIISEHLVDYVAFTGSVSGGREVAKAIGNVFHSASLELGGKDAAYIKQDTNLAHTVQQLVEGSFFNSGQSCCGVERIYVDERIYNDFLSSYINQTKHLVLDNPTLPHTTLGPMVRASSANHVREQIEEAVKFGAIKMIDKKLFRKDDNQSAYLGPQILTNVNHQMNIMREETFGPVVGIMPVKSDTEAVELINDSRYGLTFSLWTADVEYAETLFNNINVGTCLLNRCDYLDPSLAWTGVKDSGYGCSLSQLGFLQVTKPKSIYLLDKSK